MQSFVYHGHSFHLYTYNDFNDLPKGVIQKDANEILPEASLFQYNDRNTYAGFANLFRYKLLLDNGGYWSDMDIVCLRPIDFTDNYVFTTEDEGVGEIANCFFRAPAGSSLMQECYDKACLFDSSNISWGQTGPVFFQEIVKAHQIPNITLEPTAFCSIPFGQFRLFTQPRSANLLETQLKNAYGVHLWNEMWRLNNVDKNRIYTPTSIYRTLQLKYAA